VATSRVVGIVPSANVKPPVALSSEEFLIGARATPAVKEDHDPVFEYSEKPALVTGKPVGPPANIKPPVTLSSEEFLIGPREPIFASPYWHKYTLGEGHKLECKYSRHQ
jgi:hypothetical protein